MRSLILVFLLGLFPAISSALVIDFEEVPPGALVFEPVSQGFRFSDPYYADLVYASNGTSFTPPSVGDASLGVLVDPDGQAAVRMDVANNPYGMFSLNSFVTASRPESRPTEVFGGYDRYGDYGVSVLTDSLYTQVRSDGLIEYFLPDSFAGLNFVRFSSDTGSEFFVDNITVNSAFVPIPAAVWFFGSALVSLGWLRRKQAA